MHLKTLQTELQRLVQLVSAWEQPESITAIERELVLARLRDIYEAIRFGLESEAAPESEGLAALLPMTDSTPEAAPIEESIEAMVVEEEPLAVDADDFFSLDQIISVEETPAEEEVAREEFAEESFESEAYAEEPAEEVAPEEKSFEVEVMTPAEEPIAEEPIAEEEIVADEPTVVEEAAEREELVIEEEIEIEVVAEPTPEPTPEPVAEPVAEPTPEPEVIEVTDSAESHTVNTLFGTAPEVDHHRRKQRVIMSLYDVAESEPIAPKRSEEHIIEIDEEELDENVKKSPEVVETPAETVETEPTAAPAIETPAPEALYDEPQPEPTPEPQQAPIDSPTPVVLGEVIKPRQTLADTIKPQTGVGEAIRRQPITDLRRAVGLNDKFLLIRDLFGGNGSLYEITIRKLNEFTTFDDCIIYIAEHFHWNPNLDGTKLMMDLLERKFDQQ